MTVTASVVAGVISMARSTFPTAVLTLRWGDAPGQSVTALRSVSTEHAADGDLSGVIEGLRGRLRIVLSDCSPWDAPQDGDKITLTDSAGSDLGSFTVLGHDDDPTGTVRTLLYGEESA